MSFERNNIMSNQEIPYSISSKTCIYSDFLNTCLYCDGCSHLTCSNFCFTCHNGNNLLYCSNIKFCDYKIFCAGKDASYNSEYMAFNAVVTGKRYREILDYFIRLGVYKTAGFKAITQDQYNFFSKLPEFDKTIFELATRQTFKDIPEPSKNDILLKGSEELLTKLQEKMDQLEKIHSSHEIDMDNYEIELNMLKYEIGGYKDRLNKMMKL